MPALDPRYQFLREHYGRYYLAQKGISGTYAPFQQEAICPMLEAIEAGEVTRAIFFEPPRVGKSDTITIHFPAWFLGRNPDKKVMVISATSELTVEFGRQTRNLIQSQLHQLVFPQSEMTLDSRASDAFSLTRGGAYRGFGFGKQIVGFGGHIIIVDDPIRDEQDATSEAAETSRRQTITSVILNRLEPGGALIFVGHRWKGPFYSWLIDLFGSEDVSREDLTRWRKGDFKPSS